MSGNLAETIVQSPEQIHRFLGLTREQIGVGNDSMPATATRYRGLTREQIVALGPLTIGLDIGIASCGWAVLSPQRIVDLGVRCFDAAEDPKKKISLNQARRTARVGRSRNASRRSRLKRLAVLFVNIGLLTAPACAALFSKTQTKKQKMHHRRPISGNCVRWRSSVS